MQVAKISRSPTCRFSLSFELHAAGLICCSTALRLAAKCFLTVVSGIEGHGSSSEACTWARIRFHDKSGSVYFGINLISILRVPMKNLFIATLNQFV
jgi:hypothetical protein